MSSVKDSKKIHVLHVDDDASFLEVTKQILELEAGFTVESAVSADEAIKKLSTTVYDIVVSDFEMPQKDGLIFLKELREQNSHIPFVLFTGKGREEVAIKALNMGANGYYNKQGSPETVYGELIHGIKLCVELKRSADLNKLAEARFSAAFNLNSVALCISDFETGLFIDCNEQFVNLFGYSREELIGRQSALILYTNPLDRQQILDLLNKNRHLLNYEVNFKTKSGKLITALFSAKLIEVKNQIQILTTILNISESKQMKEKLKTFAHLQATVAELGQYALTQPTIDDFLDKVANDVASALDVELCKVLELLPDREYLLLRAGVGWKKGLVGKAIVDAGDTSQAGYTLKSKIPIIVDDLRTEKRFSGPALLHNHSVISGLSVIIGSLEKPFGILGAHTTHHQQFTKDDVNFMLSIANLIDAFIKLKNDKLELRKNELKFRTIADFARDWVYWISPERKFIYVSPSCEVITGYTANEFIDNPCLMRDIVVSEDKMIFGNHFDLFSSDTDHRLTFRIKTKTGQIRWIAHICQPVFDDLGNWLGRRATNIDITELKKVEHQLRASERRWAVTLSSIGDGVIATDVLGKVSFMNSVAEQLTGWTLDEAAGKSLGQVFNIVNEQSRLSVESPVAKVLLEGVVVGLANHTVLVRRDGTEVSIDDSGAPIRDDQGNITGVVLVFRDITKRKKLEEERNKLLIDYHERIKELNCLYKIAKIIEKPNISLDEILSQTNDVLPSAWKYSNIACSRIVFNDREFLTKNYTRTSWRKKASIIVKGKVVGLVEVCYIKKPPGVSVENLFLKEEHWLIDAVAERLGRVAERKIAEEKLLDSKSKYRALVDNVDEAIILTDLKGKTLFKNYAYRRHIALANGNSEVNIKIHPDDFEELKKKAKILFKTGYSASKYRVRYLNGPWIYRQAKSTLLKNTENQPYAILSVIRDITETVKAEKMRALNEVLLKSLLELNTMLDSSEKQLADFALDAIVKVSESEFVFIGILSDDESVLTFYSYSKIVMDKCAVPDVPLHFPVAKAGLWAEPIRMRKPVYINDYSVAFPSKKGIPDGHLRIERFLGVPVFEKDRIVALVAVANKKDNYNEMDVVSIASIATDMWRLIQRKAAVERLAESSREIEVVNEKLRVSGSLVRHDIRNKLTIVSGQAYLLKKKLSNQADVVEALVKVEDAVKATSKIFDFARMYEQLGVEALKFIDVEKTVTAAVALFSDFRFKLVNGCGGLFLLADSFLRQLFYNLIDNTIKYGQEATVIKVFFEFTDLGDLRLIYEDDGVGIPKENRDKLFTEGFSTGGSTGFGLFLIKRMTEIYGWTITEEGEYGKGVRFIMTIPKLNKTGEQTFQVKSR